MVAIMADRFQMRFRMAVRHYLREHPGEAEIEFVIYESRSGTVEPQRRIWEQCSVATPETLQTADERALVAA